jgi:hypothetical protein
MALFYRWIKIRRKIKVFQNLELIIYLNNSVSYVNKNHKLPNFALFFVCGFYLNTGDP